MTMTRLCVYEPMLLETISDADSHQNTLFSRYYFSCHVCPPCGNLARSAPYFSAFLAALTDGIFIPQVPSGRPVGRLDCNEAPSIRPSLSYGKLPRSGRLRKSSPNLQIHMVAPAIVPPPSAPPFSFAPTPPQRAFPLSRLSLHSTVS